MGRVRGVERGGSERSGEGVGSERSGERGEWR